MQGKISLMFSALCAVCLSEATPQYYPLPYPGQPPFQSAPDSQYGSPQPWQQAARNNFTRPNPNPYYYPNPNPQTYPNPNPQSYPSPNPQSYPNPNPQSYPDPLPAEDIYRLYGAPPPTVSAYPQIYKVDNLIIIANPTQQQPCISRPPPPQFPNPKPSTGNTDGDQIPNRINGDGEPSKCTWAIVACCSPDNLQVRYNCFELLGCPGFFFDNSPCEPKIVMAAAKAALDFYKTAGTNSSSTSTDSDTITNRL